MAFWLIVLCAAGLAAFWVSRPLLRVEIQYPERGDAAMTLYRQQLAGVSEDLARGILDEAAAKTLRAEIGRRMLATEGTSQNSGPVVSAAANWRVALVIGLGLMLLAPTIYYLRGAPTLSDQPLAARLSAEAARRAARPSQATAETLLPAEELTAGDASEIALVDQLREALRARPADLRGHEILVSSLASLGRWSEAHQAQAQVIAILAPDAPGDAYIDLAELMVLAAGGYVSPEAEAALATALQLVPDDPRGRFYSGLLLAQSGRADLALPLWQRLLDEGPQSAPWVLAAQAEIAALTADPVEDAMIAGMVAQLSDRLAREGGPVEDWVRLIRSHSVLGNLQDARAILEESRGVFAGNTAALNQLNIVAQAVGLTP